MVHWNKKKLYIQIQSKINLKGIHDRTLPSVERDLWSIDNLKRSSWILNLMKAFFLSLSFLISAARTRKKKPVWVLLLSNNTNQISLEFWLWTLSLRSFLSVQGGGPGLSDWARRCPTIWGFKQDKIRFFHIV